MIRGQKPIRRHPLDFTVTIPLRSDLQSFGVGCRWSAFDGMEGRRNYGAIDVKIIDRFRLGDTRPTDRQTDQPTDRPTDRPTEIPIQHPCLYIKIYICTYVYAICMV